MNISPRALFARWFWLVYLPLGLFFVLLALTFTELLPRWAIPFLIASSLWGALSVRLIVERVRIGLPVPPPRNLVGGSTWVVALVVTGAVLGWIGAAKLSSDVGIGLALTGAFLIVFALIAPLFKVLDLALRASRRRFKRPRETQASAPPAQQQRTVTSTPVATEVRDPHEEDEPLRVAERF